MVIEKDRTNSVSFAYAYPAIAANENARPELQTTNACFFSTLLNSREETEAAISREAPTKIGPSLGSIVDPESLKMRQKLCNVSIVAISGKCT